MLYKKWYEDFIEVNTEIRVIDATEGGAYIEGTEVMTLEKAINELCIKEVDIWKCINKCEPLFDANEKTEFFLWINKFPDYMKKFVSDLKKMQRNYDRIKNLLSKIKRTVMKWIGYSK